MRIKVWIILLANFLIIATTVILSLFFYKEFQKTLDERVLLQLTSIKRLKRIQVENYLKDEWSSFLNNDDRQYSDSLLKTEPYLQPFLDSILDEKAIGIHDITPYTKEHNTRFLFLKKNSNQSFSIKILDDKKIQKILQERTGMGQSGETYIVGDDYRLRTASRFFPDSVPYHIQAKTKGVINALSKLGGNGIIDDYRGIKVYSAYHPITLKNFSWVILSEIDVSEIEEPLVSIRHKLVIICVAVLIFVILIASFMASKIAFPIQEVSNLLSRMSTGEYGLKIKEIDSPILEVKELYQSLERLQNSLNEAIKFANQIGNMNFQTSYLVGDKDPLGESLVAMRNKLIAFQQLKEKNQQLSKKSLIEGQEEERKRLSKELHDGIGPLLTSLKLTIQTSQIDGERKKELKELIDHTIEEVRRMSFNLMPQSLLDFGVGKAIQNWVSLFRKTTQLKIDYRDLMGEEAISHQINICLFRIIQELLNNTIKHANASEVKLSLTEFEDKISLYYKDNGTGFDVDYIVAGSGIKNIKERVNVLNGYIGIHSDSSGTEVEVELPINR